MGALSPTHWLIVVGVLVLLFGAKRLPDAARSLGRSARILKSEVKDMGAHPGPPSGTGDPAAALPPAQPIAEHVAPTAATSNIDLAEAGAVGAAPVEARAVN